jgi:DNA-binding transcriptional regulator of glucitol operon
LQSISWLICIPVVMLMMSVLFEWIQFHKIQNRSKNKNV